MLYCDLYYSQNYCQICSYRNLINTFCLIRFEDSTALWYLYFIITRNQFDIRGKLCTFNFSLNYPFKAECESQLWYVIHHQCSQQQFSFRRAVAAKGEYNQFAHFVWILRHHSSRKATLDLLIFHITKTKTKSAFSTLTLYFSSVFVFSLSLMQSIVMTRVTIDCLTRDFTATNRFSNRVQGVYVCVHVHMSCVSSV